jgi:Fimbrial protein.
MKPFLLLICSGLLWAGQVSADATINFSGTLVNAPNCTINTNNTVTVDFGDQIVTSLVDGSAYKQPINYTLSCSSVAANGLKVSISGTAAPFNSTLLNTTKTGLGIQLYNGDSKLNNGAVVNFTYPAAPKLYAAPATSDPLALTAGPFTGTASLVLNYQ